MHSDGQFESGNEVKKPTRSAESSCRSYQLKFTELPWQQSTGTHARACVGDRYKEGVSSMSFDRCGGGFVLWGGAWGYSPKQHVVCSPSSWPVSGRKSPEFNASAPRPPIHELCPARSASVDYGRRHSCAILNPDRQRRYFDRIGGTYRVVKVPPSAQGRRSDTRDPQSIALHSWKILRGREQEHQHLRPA